MARLRSGSSESVDEDVGAMPSGRVFTSANAAFWSWNALVDQSDDIWLWEEDGGSGVHKPPDGGW